MKFEVISKYIDAGLSPPIRKTKASAGYDFQVAENTVIPSYFTLMNELAAAQITSEYCDDEIFTLNQIAALTKTSGCKPTLVPTGIKCEMPEDMYLELSVRSSCPLKHWLILANGVGIIDSDYYNNPDNEGHIFFQIINLSPFDIVLKKGDIIGQGIFKKYYMTNDDTATAERQGGFGSTDIIIKTLVNLGTPNVVSPKEIEECVMACNPNRYAYVFGGPKTINEESSRSYE